MRSIIVALVMVGLTMPAWSSVDPSSINYFGKKPVRVAIGHESTYQAQDGMTSKTEKGFTITRDNAKPAEGKYHYKMKGGECIVLVYKNSDVGDMRQWDEQFVVKSTGQLVRDLGGASVVGSIRRGKLWARCPQDNGFGCSNKTISDRDGDYNIWLMGPKGEERFPDSGVKVNKWKTKLESKEICALSLTNKHHNAMGKTIIGGVKKGDQFLFTVEWTAGGMSAGAAKEGAKGKVKGKLKKLFGR